MGEFTRRVRLDINVEGHVPGPLQRKFTPARWRKAFEAAGEPDEEDFDVFAAALVIHQKLNNIRDRQQRSSTEKLSATTKLRSFVAAVNHNFVFSKVKTRKAIAKAGADRAQSAPEGFYMEELTNVKLTLPSGMKVTPNAVIENLVDGIETPVRMALGSTPDLSGNPRMDEVEWEDIALELNLGIFFRHAEDVWDDCLWNGYSVVEKDRLKLFIPKSPDFQRAHRLGIARRQALGMGFSITAIKIHREFAAMGLWVNAVREVRAIERLGKRQVIKVSKPGESTRAQEELEVLRAYASEPYYAELLDEKAPGLDGLTLNDVLTAWTVISRACQVLMDAISTKNLAERKNDAPPTTWLPQYAPVLQIPALVSALGAAAGYRPKQALRLINFLTYRGEREREIWAQPLVPVGPSTVAPVFAAVVSPNLRRLVDIWMRQAGIELAKRGKPFEAHIRATTREAIAQSKLLDGKATSIAEDYTFTPPSEAGVQFDLIFFIGATVFLAEAKCILEPTEAKGIAMHRKTVLEAADQAHRRVQVLDANRDSFVADIKKRFGIDVPANFRMVPLIVISTSTHVGIPARGVPVIDEYILERFLAGELEDVAVQGEHFGVVKSIKTMFYADATEAESRAAEYFAKPPQMGRFIRGLGAEITPLPAVNEGDWEGAMVTIYCRPKEGPSGFERAVAATG